MSMIFVGNLREFRCAMGVGLATMPMEKQGWSRRARVIMATLEKGEKTWQGVTSIKTWKRLDDAAFTKIDEQTLWSKI